MISRPPTSSSRMRCPIRTAEPTPGRAARDRRNAAPARTRYPERGVAKGRGAYLVRRPNRRIDH